jgi:hypothetical protein
MSDLSNSKENFFRKISPYVNVVMIAFIFGTFWACESIRGRISGKNAGEASG